jgi:hypothetical protein
MILYISFERRLNRSINGQENNVFTSHIYYMTQLCFIISWLKNQIKNQNPNSHPPDRTEFIFPNSLSDLHPKKQKIYSRGNKGHYFRNIYK